VGTFSIGNLTEQRQKADSQRQHLCHWGWRIGHQQQNKAKLQLLLDIVLKGNKEKVVNSVNIKHQRPS
jgi:hypothetical protein